MNTAVTVSLCHTQRYAEKGKKPGPGGTIRGLFVCPGIEADRKAVKEMEENRAEQGEKTERDYMRRALELAEQGMGWTSPNPMVGAVIVKEGRIIGEGFHERYGEAHAERNAFASCREDPRGADLYVCKCQPLFYIVR